MNGGEGVEGGAVMTERELIGQAVVLLSQVVEILRSVAEGGRPMIAEPVTAEDAAV